MQTKGRTGALFGLACALAACGGSVVLDKGGGVGGEGGIATTGTWGESVSSGVGAGGAGGSANACTPGTEALTMALSTYDGKSYGCAFDNGPGQGTGDVVLQGVITTAGDGTFTLDSCPPNADCDVSISKLAISAPNLPLWIPSGAFVELRAHVEAPMGCGQRILITNLPSWGGEKNPFSSTPNLWFAAADGLDDTFPEAPFAMDKKPHACPGEVGTIYDFHFFDPKAQAPGVMLSQGQTTTWAPPTAKGEFWTLHNMRAFDPQAPDDYWNWGYWITQTPALD